jgi:hypothetical protein
MGEEKQNLETAEESKDESQVSEETAGSSPPNGDEVHKHGPLSPDDFRSVLQRLDALGLTWTADLPPLVKVKEDTARDILASDDYAQIKKDFPSFPSELSSIVFYALTRSKKLADALGERDEVEQKVAAVNNYIINANPKYRTEFFFKYAIKVPYLSDLDWEVVIKAREKNVERMPRVAYALLSLLFRQPVNPTLPAEIASDFSQVEMYTVAVDEHLVDKLIGVLSDVKIALSQTTLLADSLSDDSSFKEADNGKAG